MDKAGRGPQGPPLTLLLTKVPSRGANTHRHQGLKETVEKQVPKEPMRPFHPEREVRHEPDEEVGNDGQWSGEDNPEEGRGREWRLENSKRPNWLQRCPSTEKEV